ncbi:hypothetical protein LU646_05205 [Pseudomonas alloputida]|uniref:hypothetical protein n=1 Tax=Pseudomonas putida group TaxID=136845 RepID=UPI001E5D517C|nr:MULTISPECIES: hypothetical protein [Pseudomonas putida group]MCE1017258.1 hypothetical protein [Pseudomonas monteilii]MCE1057285.1 hypothetical protein [Pseudomonas alloputida]
MQTAHYILASSILWLAILIVLPFLISKARRRSYNDGFAEHQRLYQSYITALNKDVSQLAMAREDDQRKHGLTVANLNRNISELEQRILSYTGLAVTRADYDLLIAAVETLQLTRRTMKALKSQAQAERADTEAQAVAELARRIHSQLRNTPASAANMGEAA